MGEYCSSDYDCGTSAEYCNLNTTKCEKNSTKVACDSDSGSSQYCCRHGTFGSSTICRSSCVGEYCASDNDCGPSDEHCNLDTKNVLKTPAWLLGLSR